MTICASLKSGLGQQWRLQDLRAMPAYDLIADELLERRNQTLWARAQSLAPQPNRTYGTATLVMAQGTGLTAPDSKM